MKRKNYLTCFLFVIIGLRTFACPHLENDNTMRGKWCPVARVYMDDTLSELVNGNKVYGNRIKGVVYFEGFDFHDYDSETNGIEPMLEETYILLKEFYEKEKTPFVFLGHSQGGLRALAMSTYLKNKDPNLYKQLKGVVTFSGIDKGLKLLENKGANFRSNLYTDVNILSKGIYGIIKVFDFVPGDMVTDFVIGRIVGQSITDGVYAIGRIILSDCLGLTNGFAYPILYNAEWDNYAQIRDMCPQSDFIKKYVLEEKPYYYKVANGTRNKIVWKKGWLGIPYPTIEKETVYSTLQTTDVNMKVDKDLPLRFVVGTHNDSLSIAEESVQNGFEIGMNSAGVVFTVAELAHIAKCAFIIGLLTNSPVYAYDCGNAAAWCFGYKNEINQLLGEEKNDGLVAESCQSLPVSTKVNSSEETKVLNKTERVLFYRNHENITDTGSDSRNKINDYADSFLGIKNRSNKKR